MSGDIGVIVSPIKQGLWRARLYKLEPIDLYVDYPGDEEPTREQVLDYVRMKNPKSYETYCATNDLDSGLLASFRQWTNLRDRYEILALRMPELAEVDQ